MIKVLKNKDGSTLVLLVIIIATLIFIGISLLSITMSQYKIRKSNSEVKRAFYMSETGTNEAYVRVYDLIQEASDDSVSKADEYLLTTPEDLMGASLLFKNNYKQYILNNVINSVNDSSNPYTVVANNVGLAFVSEKLNLIISSKYITESGIEKIIVADMTILVPEYIEVKNNFVDFTTFLKFKNFNL